MSRTLLLVFVCGIALTAAGCGAEPSTEADPTPSNSTSAGSESDSQNEEGGTKNESAGSEFTVTSDNTKVAFIGTKKSGDSRTGGFKTVSGSIGVDGEAITSINVLIDVESLYSEKEKLTGHLKNEDFFSVKEFPELKFASKKVEGSGDVTITGDLTMHGQTAEISFPATVAVTDGNVKLDAKFKVDRTKFGMNYTGQPDDPINADVDIEISVGAE